MSWLQRLAETYDHCEGAIGNKNDKIPLLPICHTMQNAHIEVTLDAEGNFLSAKVIDKDDAPTLIPCTESSSGRTNGQCPHPLHDKLEYIAKDYHERTGGKCDFKSYKKQLQKWQSTDENLQKIGSVLRYIENGNIIEDLIKSKILFCDDQGKLINEWNQSDESPPIFKLLPGGLDSKGKPKPSQASAFVRFCVETPDSPNNSIQFDSMIWDSWGKYYSELESSSGVCLITAQGSNLATQHPAKIRNAGDKAKLISANDRSGFTYRGRFLEADQACSISFEITQKAHNALRWLIAKQGRRFGDQNIVAWATQTLEVPDPFASSFDLFLSPQDGDLSNEIPDELEEIATSKNSKKNKKEKAPPAPVFTAQQFADKLNNMISGYRSKLTDSEANRMVVMAVDSATPGRMAIRYYRELKGSDFLARIRDWHESCAWYQYFGVSKQFVGAPSPKDIAEVAYGKKLDSANRLLGTTVSRLMPCILDGMPLPRDLVETCVRRATQKISMEPWEWNKTLGIACALYRKQNEERNYSMNYENERNTRDYLYGSLLAIAEHIEERALYLAKEKRDTHATKLMQRFAERPYSTWRTIELQLVPYLSRLRNNRPSVCQRLKTLWDETYARFKTDDFTKDTPLSGEFLIAYHTLRKKLWDESKKSNDPDISEIEQVLIQKSES